MTERLAQLVQQLRAVSEADWSLQLDAQVTLAT